MRDVSNVSSFRPLVKVRPTVGSGAESLRVGHIKGLTIGAQGQPCREPGRWQVIQHLSRARIQRRNGIDSRAGHVKPPFIGTERHTERKQAAQSLHGVGRLEQHSLLHLVRMRIKDGDAVLVGVGDEHLIAAGHHSAGT